MLFRCDCAMPISSNMSNFYFLLISCSSASRTKESRYLGRHGNIPLNSPPRYIAGHLQRVGCQVVPDRTTALGPMKTCDPRERSLLDRSSSETSWWRYTGRSRRCMHIHGYHISIYHPEGLQKYLRDSMCSRARLYSAGTIETLWHTEKGLSFHRTHCPFPSLYPEGPPTATVTFKRI